MKVIAIDGACVNNGQEDSVGCGACVIFNTTDFTLKHQDVINTYILQKGCTNQRAELHGLLLALGYIKGMPGNYLIVTDSEYIYNALNKSWLTTWRANDWIGSNGEVIKNVDLWQHVGEMCDAIEDKGGETPCVVHIKGHVLSVGKVTRDLALAKDASGFFLLCQLLDKYNMMDSEHKRIRAAQECAKHNYGSELDADSFRRLVLFNTLADCIASYQLSKYVEQLQGTSGEDTAPDLSAWLPYFQR